MFGDTKVQQTPNTQPPCNGLFAPGGPAPPLLPTGHPADIVHSS
jgi:hypothetical protein